MDAKQDVKGELMKTALLLVATGEKYRRFISPLLESANKFFVPHDTILWTDLSGLIGYRTHFISKTGLGYPNETLYRYHTFLREEEFLRKYDQLFYCDIDMLFVAPVTEDDIFSAGITATIHPGFAVHRDRQCGFKLVSIPTSGTPERRFESTAYLDGSCNNRYFCGGFNGGNSDSFLRMAAQLRDNIDEDTTNGIKALWYDESHLNHYLYYNPPVKILTPSFCYPEGYHGQFGWPPDRYKPVLLALNKGNRT
jgi:histo-blood group ABO system transferase